MTTNGFRGLTWKELYQAAMLESRGIKLLPLLHDAINAVLDQIEETPDPRELGELNDVLNCLRYFEKLVPSMKFPSVSCPTATQHPATTSKKSTDLMFLPHAILLFVGMKSFVMANPNDGTSNRLVI